MKVKFILKLFFVLFFLGFLTASVYFYFFQNKNIEIELKTNIPNHEVESIKKSDLDLILSKVNYKQDKLFYTLKGGEKEQFDKIIIEFNDISKLDEAKIKELDDISIDNNKKTIKGIYSNFTSKDQKAITYYIYTNPKTFEFEEKKYAIQNTKISIFNLFWYITNGSRLKEPIEFDKKAKELIQEISIFQFLLEKIGYILTPKQVYASCTGAVFCGITVTENRCGSASGPSCTELNSSCFDSNGNFITNGCQSYVTDCDYGCANCSTSPCSQYGFDENSCLYGQPVCGASCSSQSCQWTEPSAPPQCPSGQIFCGGCLTACMPNTQTCNEWIEDQCGNTGGGGGGGPPPEVPPQTHMCGAECTGQPEVCTNAGLTCDGGQCRGSSCPIGPPATVCGDYCNETDGRFCDGGLSCNHDMDGDNNPNTGRCWEGSCNGATEERIIGAVFLEPFSVTDPASNVRTQQYNNIQYRQGTTGISAMNIALGSNSTDYHYVSTLVNHPLSPGDTFQTSIVPNPGYQCVGWYIYHEPNGAPINSLNCGSASPNLGQMGNGCTANFHLCTDANGGSFNNYVTFIIEQDVEVKTCSASALVGSDGQAEFGDDIQVVVSGTSSLTTPDPTRLWLEKQDYTRITPTPTGTTEFVVDGRYYYLITSASCSTSSSTTCIDEAQLAGLALGNYYVHCDMPDDPQSCSGNPVCTYNGMGGIEACTGYYDCDPDPANQNDSSAFSVVCTPSCGNSTCGDTGATPNNITGLTVTAPNFTAGKVDMTDDTNLVVNWDNATISDPASSVDFYQVRLWPQSQGATVPEANSDTCDNTTDCRTVTRPGLASFYTFLPRDWPDQTDEFYVAVRAVNNTCTGTGTGNWSTPLAIDLVTTLTGNFYEDSSATAGVGGACTGDTSTAVDLTGSTMTNNRGGVLTTLNSSYILTQIPFAPSASWPDYGYNIQLDIDNPDPANAYVCACPTGCTYTGLTSATNPTARNFFLTRYNLSNSPWWQTKGGNVYAKDSISSTIPDTCPAAGVGVCDPYFITQNGTDQYSGGIAITGGNSTSSIAVEGYYTDRDPDTSGNQPRSVDVSHANNQKEDYAYFAGLFDSASATDISTNDTGSGTLTTLPTGGQTFGSDNTEVYTYVGDLTLDFDTTQTVTGKKMVILVNGNVTIQGTPNTRAVDVANGAFFGLITSGNINIDETIGNTSATATTSVLEGVYVADGDLNIENYADDSIRDLKFVGEGTFVGHTAINLNRDYDNTSNPIDKALNNTNPIEVFVYRPDFVTNIPSILKQPNLYWQEVN